MSCPSQTFSGGEKDHTTFTNWSRRFSGPVNSIFTPNTLADLVNIIQRATSQNHAIHVVGSGWAFENIAYSPDFMISMDNLKNPLTAVTSSALNSTWAGTNSLFHIEAGAKIADVNDALGAPSVGLALPTLGGANGQSLAGALSTGTHGGDIAIAPLADMVMAMHLVTVGGREIWIERASQPITDDVALAHALTCPDTEILRNDDVFNALLVGFGRFGVIYSYVLKVMPAFVLAEWTTKITRTALTTALRAGITGGTFLAPLLALLPPPPATGLGSPVVASPRGLEVAFDTNNLGTCFVKRRWFTTVATVSGGNVADSQNPLCQAGAAGVLAAANLILAPMVGIPVYGVAVSIQMVQLAAGLTANPLMSAGQMLANVVTAFWSLNLGGSIPAISGVEFGLQYQDSMTTGKFGPSDKIVSGFRDQSLQSCYKADSIEPVFDAHSAMYINFLDSVLNSAPSFKQAGYISLRWSASSKATMSMHNFPSGNAVAIEVTSLKNLPDNAAWMTKVESFATGQMGRPHWGQINNLSAAMVGALYGPASIAWKNTLGALVGSAGIFSNAYTVQRGLEPAANATATIFGQRAGDVINGFLPAMYRLLLKAS